MAFEVLKSEATKTMATKTITVHTTLQITDDPELQQELGSVVHIIDTINAKTGKIESVYCSNHGYELDCDTCAGWALEQLYDFVKG